MAAIRTAEATDSSQAGGGGHQRDHQNHAGGETQVAELQRDRAQARRAQQPRLDTLDHAGGAGARPQHRRDRDRQQQGRVPVSAKHQVDDLVARSGR